ncbi:MAG TPA: ABC transporter substrate-binding protein [Methylomirabilota bacterium]|jgi:peptide/nickel transport system substrate-binding protein|nr:ABC transporter substrate-binding protein [Methylomirabilota bacterium]
MRHAASIRLLAVATLALALASAGPALAQKRGGVLRVGILGEPPALDAHWSTTALVETLTNHVYEGLYTLDQDNRPIPMLADGMPAVSRDGLTYTVKLRPGVRFHNGKELTSEDVVASLKRWGQQANQGKVLFKQVADLRAVDRSTVELRLSERSPITVLALAIPNNFAAIYPKEIAERFPPQQKVTEFVGTGPFRVAEWKPDQYLRMVRFDQYRPRNEPPNGYGGAKVAYVDEVRWIPVPEVATRAAQVETGELDFADDLSLDQYDRLARSPNARPLVAKPYFWLIAVFNKKEGLMTNPKLRQAWQAAVDIEPIMKAVAAGRPEFYRLDSSLMFQEVAEWHTKIPGLPYNERNVEKAKRLMKEAGYKGEPIRFLATKEYKWMYDFAVMMKQQLEDIGFTIDLQVVDWATLSTRRFNPKEYEVFTTGIGIGAQFDPMFQAILSCTWAGWTCDEEIQRVSQELARETDPKRRRTLWEQQTRLWYEKVPSIRLGDLHGLRAVQKQVRGLNENTERPRFYNVWLEK